MSTDHANEGALFSITNSKLYFPIITLSSIKSNNTGSKAIFRLLNWSNFSEVNRLFVSSFEDNTHWTSCTWYFLQTVEIVDYNAMVDEQSFFDQPVKDDLRTCDNVRKIAIGQGDD